MKTRQFKIRFFLLIMISSLPFTTANSASPKRQMEYLDRGLVAVKTDNGVFLSWRFSGEDNPATQFNIYRDNTQINKAPITGATNFTDKDGTENSHYTVKAMANGALVNSSAAVTPWPAFYKTIQMNRPEGGTTPDSRTYVYFPGDCSVGDLDGDGEYEIVVKWDPSNAHDNSHTGYTGNVYLDAYKLHGKQLWRIDLGRNIRAGAHYTQFLVYDFDADGCAEIVCKTAPGTVDGTGSNVILNNDDPQADYREKTSNPADGIRPGYIISGPEYLTVFSGEKGKNLATMPFEVERGSASIWGDSYGNRCDRYLSCVAYLDGVHPSIVMGRGYYTRLTLSAWDFREGKLSKRWIYDSGTTRGKEAYGQGNHNLSVADVDRDGKDEIIYGASAFDDNGKFLYSTGLGHGDAMHLSDLDPDHPGLEVWEVHEGHEAAYGYELHDALTGKILWGKFTGSDNGRGLAADIDAKHRGYEMWSISENGVFNCKGVKISENRPSMNFRIYWDGDLQDELLDGTKLDKWTGDGTIRLVNFRDYGARSINGTKSNPNISADILGDWREEVILTNNTDPSQLMIFTTTTPTNYRIYTLMHDPVYRLGIAWQNTSYNQPPHLGFYLTEGTGKLPQPNIFTVRKKDSAKSKCFLDDK